MWDSQLVGYYNVVSTMYLLSYFLINCASVALRWSETHPYGASSFRATLLMINMVVLLLSLCTFEIKSVINDGIVNYLSSFWNKNDMMLFVWSLVNLI